MRVCPHCSALIQEDGVSLCLECGTVLDDSENPCEESFKWALAYRTNTNLDAEMFKANLEGAGIPVQILSQVDTTRMFTIGDLAVVKIFVPSNYIKAAQEIIEAIESHNR